MIRIITLLSGHGLASLSTLARNLVIARLLGPQDYGLAVALVLLAAAAEMGTTLGLPQLIVSHKHGAGRKFQGVLHSVQIARGLLGAVMVLFCAAPLANLLGAPEATSLLRWAAIVPLVLGFTHLDPFRAQRHRKHLPQSSVLAIPALLSVAAIWPVSAWQSGPRIMLSLLLVQAFASVAVSHLMSRRRYRLSLQSSQVRQVLRYGLPLMGNGILLFAVLHGEKLVAGAGLGLAEMGLLAMGFALTLTPALILARSFQAYYLPKLRQDQIPVLGLSALLGGSYLVAVASLAPLLIPLLGSGFAELTSVIPLLACLAALRLPKSALAIAALASGRTHLPAIANLPRLLALPIIWLSFGWGGGIETLIRIAILSEITGVGIGILLARTTPFPTRDILVASVIAGLVLSGQLSLAALTCILGWALFAVGPSPLKAAA
ncbi:O-antigen/teichoic acid export membrane protein [Litoreibacter halocynthiae]|uniref:O-antigen/teichoic acid export membrane protein n=1 Tax=Litoreibacter halocynthiae TaxID=1242689 RepID=A0A4R7LDK8_9RHOB|nr:oligosaccharide flippase family protein [Litoreibacter halocynthiae]TDT73657.1 O-antigen/teichoic acid export membrane protein [Litoreibacter halocynthiae]